MRKKILLFAIIAALCSGLCGACGLSEAPELQEYRTAMDGYFDSISEISDRIDAIDTESEDYKEQLLQELGNLEEVFDAIAEEEIPEDFQIIGTLPQDASDSLHKAVEEYKKALDDPNFDSEAAAEAERYYELANEQMRYVLKILRGEDPTAEG
ncbi:MAG: hypothetical protein IJU50_11100 [Lachnospiraceae bacterium]|nr:hypothetical protein [Lachnospiraceae bacterium]